MSFYNKALEFFIEHGIKLSESQIISLKEHTAKADVLAKTILNQDKNSQFGKSIRKIDVYKNQLKRGEISQDEFNRRVQIEKDNYDNYIDGIIKKTGQKEGAQAIRNRYAKQFITDKGSDLDWLNKSLYERNPKRVDKSKIKEALSSKNNFLDKVEQPKGIKNSLYIDSIKNLPDTEREKVYSLVDKINLSDNEREIKHLQTRLKDLLGYNKDDEVEIQLTRNKYKPDIISQLTDQKSEELEGKDLYNTNSNPNIREKKPEMKNKNGVIYNSPRVYYNKYKPIDRDGVETKSGKTIYRFADGKYTGKKDPMIAGNKDIDPGFVERDIKHAHKAIKFEKVGKKE